MDLNSLLPKFFNVIISVFSFFHSCKSTLNAISAPYITIDTKNFMTQFHTTQECRKHSKSGGTRVFRGTLINKNW